MVAQKVLWRPYRPYTFWGTTKKCENKNFKLIFCRCPGLWRVGLKSKETLSALVRSCGVFIETDQNFWAVLNNCSNNKIYKPGGTFFEFFFLFYLRCFGSTDHRDYLINKHMLVWAITRQAILFIILMIFLWSLGTIRRFLVWSPQNCSNLIFVFLL